MRYALLLRGINVGGKNKLSMAELKAALTELGLSEVGSYINSGNLFFSSDRPQAQIREMLEQFFSSHYPFVSSFCLLSFEDYMQNYDKLPDWWQDDLARKDVLFYTRSDQKELAQDMVGEMNLTDEVVHFGSFAIFWGKYKETSYSKTAYHKELIKTPLYKQVTICNGRTYEKLKFFLEK